MKIELKLLGQLDGMVSIQEDIIGDAVNALLHSTHTLSNRFDGALSPGIIRRTYVYRLI